MLYKERCLSKGWIRDDGGVKMIQNEDTNGNHVRGKGGQGEDMRKLWNEK